jgi:hypothetical protein
MESQEHEQPHRKRNIITMLIRFGAELNLLQRVVYALFSLVLSSVRLTLFGPVSESWRNGDLLAAFIGCLLQSEFSASA